MLHEIPLPTWLRHALIGLGLFLVGALLAFGYSYRPLHGAKAWRIEQLETRLDERNRENLQLADELAQLKSVESTRIDPDALAQVERELTKTKRVLRQAEKDLARAERRHKDSRASATKWRKRFEELRDATPETLPAAPVPLAADDGETPGATAPVASAPEASDAQPASPGAAETGILPAEPTAEAPSP